MLIGIEAERANSVLKTGVEHYAKQLILHLAKIDQTNQYALYLRNKPEDWFFKLPENFKVKVMPFPIFWTQIRISWEMLINPVDVLLIPASALPVIHPKKSFVVIHDMAWLFYPQTFTWFNRNFLEWSTKFAVKLAYRVIAVSQATKQDLINYCKIDENKIVVIHHGYEPGSQQSAVGSQLKLPEKYVLFLSTLQPRKNLETLIEAFAKLKLELPELPHKLVVAGKPGWKFKRILRALKQYQNVVIYLNYISDQDRLAVFKRADLFVLPSFYEGFGIPILEAFASGVPVAASNISSMPEVAGDAAIYFDPKNANEMKEAIKNILLDRGLADRLRAKGKERLKMFAWEKCAQETLNIMTEIN